MSHFAQIDENNVVVQVIVIEQEDINTGEWGDPATWIQTSYNTLGGVHYGPDGKPDGGIALRKNFAGIGFTYDPIKDAFIPPKPRNSWILDENTCTWNPPIPKPEDGNYWWDEDNISWVKLPDDLIAARQEGWIPPWIK